jgi:hypothetical protein
LGVNERSSGGAEKIGEGMALKIFTEANPSLKANIKPFDITETRMLPWGGAEGTRVVRWRISVRELV